MIDIDLFIRLRKNKGLSQAALALKVGVSQQLVGEIEKGRTRRTNAIYKIAHELGTIAHILDPEIPAIEGLSAKINEELKELDEDEAIFHLQALANTLQFAKKKRAK